MNIIDLMEALNHITGNGPVANARRLEIISMIIHMMQKGN